MTVDELLDKLSRAFPAFNAKAMETWAPVYRTALSKHEGPTLRDAFVEVLSTFQPAKAKTLYPMLSDFAAHLPARHPRIAGPGGQPLNLAGRRERLLRLLEDWRRGQGKRAANGVPEVMQALEFVAGPLAGLLAWNENPEPLLLKRSEVRTAQHRAISQQRRMLYGPPPEDADLWWEQVSTIAAQWGIETTREEWIVKKRTIVPVEAPKEGRPPFKPDTSPTGLRCAELAKEFHAREEAERQKSREP